MGCSVTLRDDHECTILTAPYPRPLSFAPARKRKLDQMDTRTRVLVHNHPSGDPMPSRADIGMTRAIVAVARRSGLPCTTIIVGKDGHASLKGLRLI